MSITLLPFRLFGLAFIVLVLAIPYAAGAQSRQLSVTSFDDIRVEGGYVVNIEASPRITARAEGPREGLDGLDVELRGRTLVIRRKPFQRDNRAFDPRPVVVTLTTPRLENAALVGGGTLTLSGFDGLEIGIALDGAGRIEGTGLAFDRMTVSLEGAGTIALSGSAMSVDARNSGAGSIEAAALQVKDLDLYARGSGATGFAVSRAAEIDAQGAGRIEITGDAQCLLADGSTGIIACESGAPLSAD